jgi:hypothetical protein
MPIADSLFHNCFFKVIHHKHRLHQAAAVGRKWVLSFVFADANKEGFSPTFKSFSAFEDFD